jgi:hypothetical protein
MPRERNQLRDPSNQKIEIRDRIKELRRTSLRTAPAPPELAKPRKGATGSPASGTFKRPNGVAKTKDCVINAPGVWQGGAVYEKCTRQGCENEP